MNEITFVVFTYNEESRIEKVIRNFKNYGRILIADNKSTDRTCEIAQANGCDIFLRPIHYDYVENQELVNELYKYVKTDWIYWAFADEMLEYKTLMELQNLVDSGKYDIIDMDRKNYFYGNFCYDMYHSYNFKIFKKGSIDFTDNPIHKMGIPLVNKDRILKLSDQYFIHHFISNNAESYLNVINRYTAKELDFKEDPKITPWSFLYIALKYWIKEFIWNKGFKTGEGGMAFLELIFFYSIVKNIKHYEKNHFLSVKAIELKNDEKRESIIQKSI